MITAASLLLGFQNVNLSPDTLLARACHSPPDAKFCPFYFQNISCTAVLFLLSLVTPILSLCQEHHADSHLTCFPKWSYCSDPAVLQVWGLQIHPQSPGVLCPERSHLVCCHSRSTVRLTTDSLAIAHATLPLLFPSPSRSFLAPYLSACCNPAHPLGCNSHTISL